MRGRECSRRGEVREGFLEEVEFEDGHDLASRNAGARTRQESLTENRKGKGQAVGSSGARTTPLSQEKGSRLRRLGERGSSGLGVLCTTSLWQIMASDFWQR